MLPLILTIKSVQRLLPFAGILAIFALVGGLYLWGDSQRDARAEAEASLSRARAELSIAAESIKNLEEERAKIEQAMLDRDVEKQETQERLRSASAELNRLRRQNAELRDWLDRPIPADVVRLLREAGASHSGGKAIPAKDPTR